MLEQKIYIRTVSGKLAGMGTPIISHQGGLAFMFAYLQDLT